MQLWIAERSDCGANQLRGSQASLAGAPSKPPRIPLRSNLFRKSFQRDRSIRPFSIKFKLRFFGIRGMLLHPVSIGGAFRDRHDTRGGDVVGRETSQRSIPDADERCFADGEIAWSWRPDAGAKPVDDPRVTVANCGASRGCPRPDRVC
jgi:hypothetical protein